MSKNTDFSTLKPFIKKIIALDIGLFALAGLISLILNSNFGIILFLLGILVGGIGSYLGGSGLNPKKLNLQDSNRPNEQISNQILYNNEHSIPQDAFENIMVNAGLIAVLLSIPLLLVVMFS
jgi:hypothetical protein